MRRKLTPPDATFALDAKCIENLTERSGLELGTLGVIALAQRSRARGSVRSALGAMIGSLAVSSAVASMVFSGSTLMWLSFGDGLGLAALAIGGLFAHELSTERVVHTLSAAGRSSDSTVKTAEQYPAAA